MMTPWADNGNALAGAKVQELLKPMQQIRAWKLTNGSVHSVRQVLTAYTSVFKRGGRHKSVPLTSTTIGLLSESGVLYNGCSKK